MRQDMKAELACPTISDGAVETGLSQVEDSPELRAIEELDRGYEQAFRGRYTIDNSLTRSLVSFQADKTRAIYRWFKYKEAFSAGLVENLLSRQRLSEGMLLDPFAGSGTALFAAAAAGMKAEGIELLPIGQQIMATKQLIDRKLKPEDIASLEHWAEGSPWKRTRESRPINELRITRGAYPAATHEGIERYLAASGKENDRVNAVLIFALLCVLESVSYTRKDGQYLRWDYRSGRHPGKKIFDKGNIPTFDEAITEKLGEIVTDLKALEFPDDLFLKPCRKADVVLRSGSCLEWMPALASEFYDCILTSPPYCNRYDYTRTYALELALLGVDEAGIVKLRQEMLSCTVENRAKDLLEMNSAWKDAVAAADAQQLLQAILSYLDSQRELELLNNVGIPRMVRGYFHEMACVIAECARVLKPGAPLLMVNDNVRYAGTSISVDLILSDIAQKLGFTVERILVLPNGKGNSSQQMGAHGREPLRKCVYVWRKR